jgi:hypothetical protein
MRRRMLGSQVEYHQIRFGIIGRDIQVRIAALGWRKRRLGNALSRGLRGTNRISIARLGLPGWYLVLACLVLACLVLAYLVLACLVLAYLVLAYLVLAYLVLIYLHGGTSVSMA